MHTTIPIDTNNAVAALAPYPYTQAPANQVSGSVSVGSGVASVAVSYPFGVKPSQVIPTLTAPTGGLVLAASVDKDSITDTGFTCNFSGLTDSDGYVLDWLAII